MSKNGANGGKLTSIDAKKLEQAITEKQELEARAQTLATKLKCTEEALGELKSKVSSEIASEIESMLQRRLSSELAAVNNSSSGAAGGAGGPPPPPPPPGPPPFLGLFLLKLKSRENYETFKLISNLFNSI